MSREKVQELVAGLSRINEWVRTNVTGLSQDEFNLKPDAKTWSIAQVVDHLYTSNEFYFEKFDALKNGPVKKTFWQQMPLLPGMFTRLLKNSFREGNTRKVSAPGIFNPSSSAIPLSVIGKFLAQQEKLAAAMQDKYAGDPGKLMVTSPVARFVTYTLMDCFEILVMHEQRHQRQMERILKQIKK